MSFFDVAFVALVGLAVFAGYQLGFATRVLSWAGFGLGLVIGVKLLPWLLDRVARVDYPLVVAATAGVVLSIAMIGELLGYLLGRRMAPRSPATVRTDRILGGISGLIGAVALTWLMLPPLTATPGWPAQLVADSFFARVIDEHLPEPPGLDDALRALIGEDHYPEVFNALQPPVSITVPPATDLDPGTVQRIAASVVKIRSEACDRIQYGSGFAVGDSLVVTNAHVVAGEDRTSVERDDGTQRSATVVAFDPGRDLALLTVARLDRAPLALATAERGDTGGVFGHPEGGPLRIAPFVISRVVEASGKDIYGVTTVRRDVLELAAELQRGDSGSAVVDTAGEVVGVAFAISPDQANVAYALATSEVDALLQVPRGAEVDTGPCLG